MIKSVSPLSANLSTKHTRSSSHSSITSDHEQRQGAGSVAGSAMSTERPRERTSSGSIKSTSKRHSSEQEGRTSIHSADASDTRATPSHRRDEALASEESRAKRAKASDTVARTLPYEYENCSVSDLVQVICEMLIDLIRINDPLPLQDGGLTRFHSRAPPAISVLDYLQRLTTHATLSPPILLSMVYYIDKLCALYPAFTISSLTVHRFLIASATVASKGLSDAFWTNGTYARVGGVSIRELALLELELLWRIDWRIVPQPEILTEYYRSLVARSEGFKLEHLEQAKLPKQPETAA